VVSFNTLRRFKLSFCLKHFLKPNWMLSKSKRTSKWWNYIWNKKRTLRTEYNQSNKCRWENYCPTEDCRTWKPAPSASVY